MSLDHMWIDCHEIRPGHRDLSRGHFVCGNCGQREPFDLRHMSVDFFTESFNCMTKLFTKAHRRCKPGHKSVSRDQDDPGPTTFHLDVKLGKR